MSAAELSVESAGASVGVASVGVASVGVASLSGLTLPERVEHLRRRMATVPSRAESVSAPIPMERVEDKTPVRPVLPVPQALARLLPHGGLARGSVVSVSGAGSLLLGLVASVTGAGSHVAVIGQPRFGLLAAAEMGAQLSRLALVPDPGPDPVEVAAILLDGVDLVVLGLGGLSVPPSRARAVVARARSKGATLVVTDGHWDGVDLRLDASVQSYGGLGTGTEIGRGRVRAVQLAVRVEGKAMRPQTTSFDLRSEGSGIEWFARDGVEHGGVMHGDPVPLRAAASS